MKLQDFGIESDCGGNWRARDRTIIHPAAELKKTPQSLRYLNRVVKDCQADDLALAVSSFRVSLTAVSI
jgi:hypothetical protein